MSINSTEIHLLCTFFSFSFDKKIFKMNMEGFHKQLKVLGNYNLKGKLFLIPIDSKGNLEIIFSTYYVALSIYIYYLFFDILIN